MATPTISRPARPATKTTLRERYYCAAREAGCPKEQVENFWRAGLILQPRQLKFAAAARQCDAIDGPTDIGYGGSRGSGKSFVILAQMGADDCQRQPGLKCLLLRKVGKAGVEHFQDVRLRLFSRLPHTFTNKGILTFPNGSRIIAGHFKSENDIDAYLGLEYDVIGIEEATTLTSAKIKSISTCCRTSKPDWRPRIYSSSNPGGVGHSQYRARFILPHRAGQETATRFIPALVDDNRFTNRDYVKVLDSLTGWQLRAWRHGDWDIAAGQYFTTFRREVHVVPRGDFNFDERQIVKWRAAMDYGYQHFTVVLLGGSDRDGREFIVDCHAGRQMLPEQHAAQVHAMFARHKFLDAPITAAVVGQIAAGADVFADESNGVSVAKQFQAAGLRLVTANMERVNGWSEILKRLGDQDRGIAPTLFIHERCKMLIDQLPQMQHDPKHPEDVLKVDMDEDGNGGDDYADCARYFCATKASEVKMVKFGS